jgi:NADH-quinone oxidoreductase subunit E
VQKGRIVSEMTTTGFSLSAEDIAELEELAKRYPRREALMLPTLWKVMDQEHWISPEAMEWVAKFLDVAPSKVYGVVGFYHMYLDRKPGKHIIEVCQTTACAIMGAEGILDTLHEMLEVGIDEPTADGRFMIRRVECLGACEHAPVCQVDHEFRFDLTPEGIRDEVERLSQEKSQENSSREKE